MAEKKQRIKKTEVMVNQQYRKQQRAAGGQMREEVVMTASAHEKHESCTPYSLPHIQASNCFLSTNKNTAALDNLVGTIL